MSLKRKSWWKSSDLTSAKMTVKSQLPPAIKLGGAVLLLAVCLGAGIWLFQRVRAVDGFDPRASLARQEDLQKQLEKLSQERDRLTTIANAAESRQNMDQSAQKQLVQQVRNLEAENVRLKEDLAFFEKLLPANTGASGISIRRIKLEAVAPNQLRYRLLVMQGGKGDHQFDGELQLSVSGMQGGKSAIMLFPDAKSNDADKYKISFKHYQRLEGMLNLPDGFVVNSVQARVLQKGQLRTQQSATL